MNTFLTQMDGYHKYLDVVKHDLDEKGKIPNKFVLNGEKLAMLSYKPTANANVVEKKDENEEVDLKKLIKFFKHNNDKRKAETISNNNNNRNKQDVNSALVEQILTRDTEDPGTNSTLIIKNEVVNSAKIEAIFEKKREALKDLLSEKETDENYERKLKFET